MKKIRVIWPGKTKKSYYKTAIEDYALRIQKMTPFELVETREESATDQKRAERREREGKRLLQKRSPSVIIFLDEKGEMITSEHLAGWLDSATSDIDFIIGGPQGFSIPPGSKTLSLSKMTFPHELARVILLEQIFRAVTILKRIPYHK